MAIQVGPLLQAFFSEPNPAIIGTTRADGSVHMNPVWYEFHDGLIWLNGGPTRDWVRHVRRDPRITILVVDPKNMFRWAQIHGRLLDTTAEGADEHIDRLAQRYFGGPYPNPKIDRLIVRIQPERIRGGDTRQPWDVSET